MEKSSKLTRVVSSGPVGTISRFWPPKWLELWKVFTPLLKSQTKEIIIKIRVKLSSFATQIQLSLGSSIRRPKCVLG